MTTIANTETAKTQIDAHAPSIGVDGPTSYDIGGGISVENDKNDKRTVHVANLSIAMNQDALVQLISHEQARTAKGLNGMEIGGRSLKVEFAKQSRLIGTTTNVVIHYGPQQQLALEREEQK